MTPDSNQPSPPPEKKGVRDPGFLWRPKRTMVVRSIEQYSKFVSFMKIALPVAAAVLLLIVIFLPMIREQEDRFRIGNGAEKEGNANSLSMTNARYYGTDEKGEPYTVTAQSVHQNPSNDHIINLTRPNAEITLKDGDWLSASADSGVLNRDAQVLDLKGDVTVYQYQGNELHTAAAHVNLKDGSADGHEPVTGQGPFGQLQATGFSYSKGTQVLKFTGPARLVINNDRSKTASPTPESTPTPAPGGSP